MARNINNKNKCLDYFCKNKLAKPKSKLCIESLEYLQEGIIKPCDDDHCPFYIDTKGLHIALSVKEILKTEN